NAQRVMCPSRMAVQMSAGRRPRVAWNRAQSPSGTTICDTIEMYSGDRVSPVPWSPPVYVRATVTNNPETLRKPSSCTPRPTTTGSVMPNSPSSECGIVRNRTPIAAARPRPIPAATVGGQNLGAGRPDRAVHGVHVAVGTTGPQVLTAHGRGGAHQPHRRPRDEGEQLGVPHRIGGLRLGALRERADETEQQDARDVHRDPLNAG